MKPKPVLVSNPAGPMFCAVFWRTSRTSAGVNDGFACSSRAATAAAWGAAAEVPEKLGKPPASLSSEPKKVVSTSSGPTIEGLNARGSGGERGLPAVSNRTGVVPPEEKRFERGRCLVVGRSDCYGPLRVGVAVDRAAVDRRRETRCASSRKEDVLEAAGGGARAVDDHDEADARGPKQLDTVPGSRPDRHSRLFVVVAANTRSHLSVRGQEIDVQVVGRAGRPADREERRIPLQHDA